VYQVSAADLTVERGRVHCGFCDAYFDALDSLTDHPPTHGPPARGLSAPAAPALTTATDDDEPRDEFDDDSPTGEVPLVSAEERIVADAATAPPDMHEIVLEMSQDPSSPESGASAAQDVEAEENPTQPSVASELAAELVVAGAISADVPESATAATPAPREVDEPVASEAFAEEAQPPVAPPAPPSTPAHAQSSIAANTHPEAASQAQPDAAPEPEPEALDIDELRGIRRSPWARACWSFVAVFMLLLLGAQLVHRSRFELILRPAIAPWMYRIYGALGVRLDPKWEVARYRVVRRPEMSVVVAADGGTRLRLVATLTNDASRPQPYPLVRLTLEDRWGSAVGARDFAPAEYMHDDARAARLLAPGEQAQVDLLVIDPGTDTVGFTVDMCLADADGVIHCANDDS
jgi:hypothetical protein